MLLNEIIDLLDEYYGSKHIELDCNSHPDGPIAILTYAENCAVAIKLRIDKEYPSNRITCKLWDHNIFTNKSLTTERDSYKRIDNAIVKLIVNHSEDNKHYWDIELDNELAMRFLKSNRSNMIECMSHIRNTEICSIDINETLSDEDRILYTTAIRNIGPLALNEEYLADKLGLWKKQKRS